MKLGIKKLHIPGIKMDSVKRIYWSLGRHAFSLMLFFILLAIAWGMFLFYQYIIVIESQQPENVSGAVTFQYGTYQKVLQEWDAKNQLFQNSSAINYTNPFTTAAATAQQTPATLATPATPPPAK